MVPCRLEDVPKFAVMKGEYFQAVENKEHRKAHRLFLRIIFHLYYETFGYPTPEYPRIFNVEELDASNS